MKTNEIREKYLEFFKDKGHTIRPSDVLVPRWDKTVIFTPAGMNQFKDHFLGKVELEYTRATTCQKCLRTGDIENVGRTAFHHTFFEMLGNFSFGDYFKREAIHWAWEFLTDKKWLGIDPARLSVTVYKDDDEAAKIWADEIGVGDRITREDEDENFWPASAPSQGPDGVCGPCSEIYFLPDDGNLVEIWNLVFTQFNRVGDPPNNLEPLPSKNIDTGMGLERIAATMQGVTTNYHIDTLRPIVEAAGEICKTPYDPDSDGGRRLRRITDHVRACTFCIHENVFPGAKKDEYVVKRLLRRAVLDGHQLGMREPFLFELVPNVIEQMAEPYPELGETVNNVQRVIEKEEKNFFDSIDDGIERVTHLMSDLKGSGKKTFSGDVAAKLYTTHGIPPELIETLGEKESVEFDWPGFDQAMKRHAEDSNKLPVAVMGSFGPIDEIQTEVKSTEFCGYDETEMESTIVGLVSEGARQQQIGVLDSTVADADRKQIVFLNRSPFYAESGGQVGDTGKIQSDGGVFRVEDAQKMGDCILHIGEMESGTLESGQTLTAAVDVDRRNAIRRAHSATHILHHALQQNVGAHAQQRGSKVTDDWLRFDFANPDPVSNQVVEAVEADSNQRVRDGDPIKAEILPLTEAKSQGAMMLFGEKYPDPVRMVSIGDFSKELCGGTHLENTSQVEAFEVIGEEGVAAGTRRITAVTGEKAKQHQQRVLDSVQKIAESFQLHPEQIADGIEQLAKQIRDLKKRVSAGSRDLPTPEELAFKSNLPTGKSNDYWKTRATLRDAARKINAVPMDLEERVGTMFAERNQLLQQLEKIANAETVDADGLIENAVEQGETKIIAADIPGGNPNLMRSLIDQVRKKTAPSAVFLTASTGPDKVLLVAGLSNDLVDRGLSAGDWVKQVAPVVGGGGGGRPDMAQAGGKKPEKIGEAIEKARDCMIDMLSA